jgi:2,3-bisphosphoglycerate-independent phosphoglycerate mutase
MPLKPGDVAFRTNFATANSSGRIIDRRAGRLKDAVELETLLNKITLTGGVKALPLRQE